MSIIGSSRAWGRLKARKKRHPKAAKQSYSHRKANVLTAGHTSYDAYLKSEEWARIRERTLYDWPLCLLCDNPSHHVHHMDYSAETLRGNNPFALVGLCAEHHRRIEFAKDGSKRTLDDANRVLFQWAAQMKRFGWVNAIKGHYHYLRKMST